MVTESITNIEAIHLNSATGPQTLTLSLQDVIDMTSTDNVLQITGNVSGDTINLTATAGYTYDGVTGLFSEIGGTTNVTITPVNDTVDITVNVVDDNSSFTV